MFADIVGYSAIMQMDEQVAAAARKRHREVFEKVHPVLGGEIVQYYGDGALSVFSSAVQAVKCALEIQKQLLSGDTIVPLRIGIHLGDIVFDQSEVYGDGVNVAARIEAVSEAGCVLISENVNNELRNQPQLQTQRLGHYSFKNISHPVEVFAVVDPILNIPKRSKSLIEANREKAIAILPFVNVGGNPENEYFCDGMTEEIINALSKVKGLKVTSRTSSFYYKGKEVPIPKIGAELNVSIILEGSIRMLGNKMRLTAQLIDVAEDYHFFSEVFDRQIDDVFAVQDEVSLKLADRLREHLGHLQIGEHLVVKPAATVDSYNSYLRARFHILKMTKSDILKGIDILKGVAKESPDYLLAYLGLHLGYTMLATIGLMPAKLAFMEGKVALDRAIEIDPEHPECLIQLSYVSFLQDWDLKSALNYLSKAGQTLTSADIYASLASVVIADGQFKAAHNYVNEALELDPMSNVHHHLKGFILYCEEKFEEANKYYERSLELQFAFVPSVMYMGQSILLSGDLARGREYFQQLDENIFSIEKLGGIALADALKGEYAKAEKGLVELEKKLDSDLRERAVLLIIQVLTAMERYEDALARITEAHDARQPMLVYYFVEPLLKPLWNKVEFKHLRKQVLGEVASRKVTADRYQQPLLKEKEIEVLKMKLDQVMTSDKPYLDPNLSLRRLAELLEVKPNKLSQLLNEGYNKNFSEFVNGFRLEEYKELVRDASNSHLTMLALAFESGFNSKTVFNTYFKRSTGMTPREFWKKMASKQ